MNKSNKFSPEVRERAVRMVQEHRGEYPSLWLAVESIAPKIGCVPQMLLTWVKRSERLQGTGTECWPRPSSRRVKSADRHLAIRGYADAGVEPRAVARRRPSTREN